MAVAEAASPLLDYSESKLTEWRLEEDWGQVYSGAIRPAHSALARGNPCPFCGGLLRQVYYGSARYDYETPTGDERVVVDVLECRCGWWDADFITRLDASADSDVRYERYSGILRTFKPETLDLPLDAVRSAAIKDPTLLDYIQPAMFERYVGALLSDHILHCEVRHCGRSHDGGIDLFAVDCDKPLVVQVKRRQNLGQSEGVAAVREFVGAMVAGNHVRGMFVTSRQFSRSAQAYAASIVDTAAVEEFTLVDGGMLTALFDLEAHASKPPWLRHLPPPAKLQYLDRTR